MGAYALYVPIQATPKTDSKTSRMMAFVSTTFLKGEGDAEKNNHKSHATFCVLKTRIKTKHSLAAKRILKLDTRQNQKFTIFRLERI